MGLKILIKDARFCMPVSPRDSPWGHSIKITEDRGENGILGPKRSNFVRICTQKIVFVLVDEKKTPQKDRVWYPEGQKRGSKPRHICITHHIGSTPPPQEDVVPVQTQLQMLYQILTSKIYIVRSHGERWRWLAFSLHMWSNWTVLQKYFSLPGHCLHYFLCWCLPCQLASSGFPLAQAWKEGWIRWRFLDGKLWGNRIHNKISKGPYTCNT